MITEGNAHRPQPAHRPQSVATLAKPKPNSSPHYKDAMQRPQLTYSQINKDTEIIIYPDDTYEIIVKENTYHSDEFQLDIDHSEVLETALTHLSCI